MEKICVLDQLRNRLRLDRQMVFTHGAFDLFHPGHLEFLKRSKELGGTLVVGIDHDESIHTYKKSQTVFSQDYRMNILARFDFIDYILPLKKYTSRDDVDYYFLKLYLLLKPTHVTYGQNFPFIDQVNEKCLLSGIQARKVIHRFSTDVSTTKYAYDVVRNYINEDKSIYGSER